MNYWKNWLPAFYIDGYLILLEQTFFNERKQNNFITQDRKVCL